MTQSNLDEEKRGSPRQIDCEIFVSLDGAISICHYHHEVFTALDLIDEESPNALVDFSSYTQLGQ